MSRSTRPVVKLDSQLNTLNDSEHDVAFRGAYTGTELTYAGFARPGSQTSSPLWKIMLLQYDGSGNLSSITWPVNSSGQVSSDYEFIWDDRATLTYS